LFQVIYQQLDQQAPAQPLTVWALAAFLLFGTALARGETEIRNDQAALGVSGAALLISPPPIEGVVGDISISNRNVFDLTDPAEGGALYRFANRIHVRTRADVIEQQLLLKPGDDYSAQAIEESERILRANRYIHDASITPVLHGDGVVDLEVATTDVWTLMPKLSYTQSGGASDVSVGIKETNLFGTGVMLELDIKSDPDRDSKILRYKDQNLGDSWYGLSALYSDNSDGHDYALDFGKPFYSLDSKSSNRIYFQDFDRVDSFYDRGELASEYRHEGSTQNFAYGWSRGLNGDWVRRFSVGYVSDEHLFSNAEDSLYPPGVLPANRILNYPVIGFEIVEDQFEKTSNVNQIHRVEDRYFGTRFGARLGYASEGLGSDRDAWIIDMNAHTGFGSSAKNSLMLDGGLEARLEQGDVQNLKMMMSAGYYRRYSERSMFHVGLSGYLGHNLDLDNYVQLGGDSGIRGYPLRYQTGDSAVLLTVEHRLFTKWYPFRLFRVGGAIFFDAGRTWGSGEPSVSDNELLRDVGIGLRLGGDRSGLGRMIHIDLAFPLDGRDDIDSMQLYISTKKSF